MSTSSPFDDATEQEVVEPTRRKRRPWWHWNVITLALALFALVWLRTLMNLDLGTTWVITFSIIFVWGLVPVFIVPTWLTTMPDRPNTGAGPPLSPWAGNLPLVVLKVFAAVFGVFSLLHFSMVAYAVIDSMNNPSGPFGGLAVTSLQRLMQYSWMLIPAGLEFMAAAILFVLTEIALRLEKR